MGKTNSNKSLIVTTQNGFKKIAGFLLRNPVKGKKMIYGGVRLQLSFDNHNSSYKDKFNFLLEKSYEEIDHSWRLKAIETASIRLLEYYTHESQMGLYLDYEVNFFTQIGLQPETMLREINDAKLREIFRAGIRHHMSNEQAYIDLLKLLKPEWWHEDRLTKCVGKEFEEQIKAMIDILNCPRYLYEPSAPPLEDEGNNFAVKSHEVRNYVSRGRC